MAKCKEAFSEHYQVEIGRYANGLVHFVLWRQNGVLHRLDGPAEAYFDEYGRPAIECWYLNGKTHRDQRDGPAFKSYDEETGVIVRESYYLEGRIHRTDGPAIIDRDAKTGETKRARFYRAGKPYRRITRADQQRALGLAPS